MAKTQAQITVDLAQLQSLVSPTQFNSLTSDIKGSTATQAGKTIQSLKQFVNTPIDRQDGYFVELQEKSKQYERKDGTKVVEVYYVIAFKSTGRMQAKNFSSGKQLKALGVSDTKVLAMADHLDRLNEATRTINRFIAAQA